MAFTTAFLVVIAMFIIAVYAGAIQSEKCDQQCFPQAANKCANTYAVCSDGAVRTWQNGK